MSTNTENIEARLCAFVEGDLDEQGRAEIEKHLETHPAHRALLQELKRTKVMMMSLPHEQAPVDLAETLQGHLERSVLLDGVGTDHLETTLRINRWPQLMGVAAVVLLALGLGVLVYVVLPQHSSAPVAMSTKDGLIPSAGVGETAKLDDTATVDRRLRTAGEDKELGKVGSKPTDIVATTPGTELSGDASRLDVPASAANPEISKKVGDSKDGNPIVAAVEDNGRRFGSAAKTSGGMFASKVAAKPGAPAAPDAKRVYVVVSTDNLETTNGKLAGYLVTNKIAWQPMNREVFETQSSGDLALASRMNNQQYRLNVTNNFNSDYGNTGNTYGGKKSGDNNYQQYSQASNGNYASKGASTEPVQVNPGGGGGNAPANGMAQNGTNNTDTQTQAGSNGQVAGANLRQELNSNAGAAQQGDVPSATLPLYDLAGSKSESVIVARGLSQQQAVELGQSLDKLYAGQTTVVIDRDAVANVTGALKQESKTGSPKVLETRSDEKTRIDHANGPATTEPSTTQPAKAEEGAPPVIAVGPTTVPAADAVQTQAGKPQSDPAAQLTLQQQPSTQPGQNQESNDAVALDLQAKPAIPAEEKSVDVVIVVQPAVALNITNQQGAAAPAVGGDSTTRPADPAQVDAPTPLVDPLPTTQPTEPVMGK